MKIWDATRAYIDSSNIAEQKAEEVNERADDAVQEAKETVDGGSRWAYNA